MFVHAVLPDQFRQWRHWLVCLSLLGVMLLSPVPAARAGDVGGPIDADTTWTLAGSPYIVTSPVLVMEGVTLTIEPGVTVKFASHKALQVAGELIAMGTSNQPITFTSNVGTAPGDWDYILFTDSSADAVYDVSGAYQSGSILSYVVIEYAGGATVDNNGALRLDAAAPFITHSTIRHSASAGIMAYNSPTTLKMTHNSIMDNAGIGVYVTSATSVEITDSTIAGNNTNAEGGGGGGIRVDSAAANLISRNVIRGNTGWSGSGIQLYDGTSTINDNVIAENAVTFCNPCGENSVIATGNDGQTTIRNNLIAYNLTGGIVGNNSLTIVENILIHNQGSAINLNWADMWNDGGGTISHNILSDNATGAEAGAMRVLRYRYMTISHNSIVRNTALNNAALAQQDRYAEAGDDANVISANTMVGNINQGPLGDLRAVAITGHPLFNDNNLYNNTGYALYYLSAQGLANLNAENNWWGVSTNPEIQALIHDWFDDPTIAIVDASPYRTAHNLDAPVAPPTGLSIASGPTSISLSWAANPESDVIGYKVYYDVDEPYPYTGAGADQGDSPIDVGNALSITLTGLPVGRYHFAVTAYDASADGAHDQTDGNESWLSLDKSGLVGTAPQAEFSALPTGGLVPLPVTFTNESTGAYSTCAWNFGDGGTSTSCSNPTHTYTQRGVYTVTLTVNGDLGASTRTRTSYISVYAPAHANFTGLPTQGPAPLVVTFTDQSAGDYTSCAWNFGDGSSSTACNPAHTYTSGGVYTVTLTINGPGGSDVLSRPRYITVLYAVYLPAILRQ